jgi:hypothetical protein
MRALGIKSATFVQLAEWLAPPAWQAPPVLPADADWPRVVEVASHHLVTPALAWRLLQADALPHETRSYLEAVLFLNRERNAKLAKGLTGACRVLNRAGVTPQLLKGAGLLLGEAYPDSGMRFIGDLDLLVREAELAAARDALMRAGFRAAAGEKERADWHQLPMLTHPETGIGIELHRHPVTKALTPLADGPGLLGRGVETARDGAAFTIPAPEDRAVLAFAHGQWKDRGLARGVPPLRALLDLALHQHRFGAAIDWEEVDRRFAAVGLDALLHDTLALSQALMQMPPPFPLLPRSEDAVRRMHAALDKSALRKAFGAIAAMARALPGALARPPAEQLAALSPARWRARLARYHPRW